jgi:hypothetical protein
MVIRRKIPTNLLLSYLALGAGTLALSLAAMFIRWSQALGVVTGFYRLFLSTLILLPFFVGRRHLTKHHVVWYDSMTCWPPF